MKISRIFGQNIYIFYVKSTVCLLFYISFSAAHSPSRIDVDFVESLEIHLLKIIISFFASIKCPQWIFLVKKKYRKFAQNLAKKKKQEKTALNLLFTLATVAPNTRVVRLHQTTILLQFYHNWQMGKNIEQLLSLCRFFSFLLVLK